MEAHLDHIPAASCEAGVDLGQEMALTWPDAFFEAEVGEAAQRAQYVFLLVSSFALHDYF